MRSFSVGGDQPASRTVMVILRVYLGIVFLLAVWSKFGGDPGFASRLPIILERMAENSHGFYRSFLTAAVLPHATVFAGLIIAGELVAALSLIFGIATRLGAGLAMFLVLNYMLMKGAWLWTPSSNDAAFFVIGLVVMVGAAGRAFGIDSVLARRWPRLLLW